MPKKQLAVLLSYPVKLVAF